MNKYYKNVILCGEIDYYCLLCEESFELTEQLEKHVRWDRHRKNIKNLSYIPKYKKDCIYKIRNYHYCEMCNYVLTSNRSINDHINEEKHKFHKANRGSTTVTSDVTVTRNKNGLVRCQDMTMSKLEWHGIVNNYCVLCDIVVNNVEHIKEPDHMIALVQSKMIMTNDKKYNRKINEETIYCFICKKLFAKDIYHECDTSIVLDGTINIYSNKILQPEDDEDETFNDLLRTERKYFYINLQKSTARCFQCKYIIDNTTLKLLNSHRKIHCIENDESNTSDESVKFSEVTDHGKRRSDLAKYGRKHFIKLNSGGSKGYCYLCDVTMSAHMNIAKEHVRGTRHQGMLLTKRIKKGIRYDFQLWAVPAMKPLHAIVREVLILHHVELVSINNIFFVDIRSFLLIKPIENDKMKCFACDLILKREEFKEHSQTNGHKKNLSVAFVVMVDYEPGLADEFVRKVKPDLYHCGYCNQLIPYWDQTHLHMKSLNHLQAKKSKMSFGVIGQRYVDTNPYYFSSKNCDTLLQKLFKLGLLNNSF